MIDVENMLFTAVKTAQPQKVKCGSQYTREQSEFPYMTLEVKDNSVYDRFINSKQIENAAEIMVEVNAYSNSLKGKKEEAKKVIKVADEVLGGLGLVRIFCQPTPNLEDATVFRMTARYRAIVDEEHNFYRR